MKHKIFGAVAFSLLFFTSTFANANGTKKTNDLVTCTSQVKKDDRMKIAEIHSCISGQFDVISSQACIDSLRPLASLELKETEFDDYIISCISSISRAHSKNFNFKKCMQLVSMTKEKHQRSNLAYSCLNRPGVQIDTQDCIVSVKNLNIADAKARDDLLYKCERLLNVQFKDKSSMSLKDSQRDYFGECLTIARSMSTLSEQENFLPSCINGYSSKLSEFRCLKTIEGFNIKNFDKKARFIKLCPQKSHAQPSKSPHLKAKKEGAR